MTTDTAVSDASTRGATRFFWIWLTMATSVSVAGNVAHAVLTAPGGTVRLAAAAAVVPPAVLLGSTHSVALLVRARRVGFMYWCALAMTIALAGCAFVLSFDALRDLVVALGMSPDRAWLWPVAIDVSIANSTLSLLSLAPPATGADPANRPDGRRGHTSTKRAPPAPAPDRGAGAATVSAAGADGASARSVDGGPRGDAPRRVGPLPASPTASEPGERALAAVPGAVTGPAVAAARRWRPAADQLVRSGVTSKDPAIVAAVLAEHAAGAPPGAISRRHHVHHSTVGRILAGAAELPG
jgi:hypothetical protein